MAKMDGGLQKHRRAGQGRGRTGQWARRGQTWMCCCSRFFSLCSCRLHSSSSPTRASSSATTSSSSCLRAASRPRVSSASEHSSASARSCSARRARSSSSWGWARRSVVSAPRMALCHWVPPAPLDLLCSSRCSLQTHSSPRSPSQNEPTSLATESGHRVPPPPSPSPSLSVPNPIRLSCPLTVSALSSPLCPFIPDRLRPHPLPVDSLPSLQSILQTAPERSFYRLTFL